MFEIPSDKKNLMSQMTKSNDYSMTIEKIEFHPNDAVIDEIFNPVTTSGVYTITKDTNKGNDLELASALPDLSVTSLVYNTGVYPFTVGKDAQLRYSVRNTGGVAANNVHVGIYINGIFLGAHNLGNLLADYTYTISFALNIDVPGNHTITIEADCYNNVVESNENNNTRSAIFTWLGLPDLVVEVLSDGNVNEVQAGNPLGYEFYVYNIGTETAHGPFELDLVVTNGIETSTITFEVDYLPAGRGVGSGLNINFGFGSVGNVIVVADSTNVVEELNENNNRASHTCRLIYHVYNIGSNTADWVHSTEAHYGNGIPSLTRPSIRVSTDASNLYSSNELNAIKRWNNISSNVIIDNYVVSDQGSQDVRITTTNFPPFKLGEARVEENFTWTSIMLTNNPITLNMQSTADRARTVAHEMGHALGLAHPEDNSIYPSIMFQSDHVNKTFEVTNADKYNIRILFGQ